MATRLPAQGLVEYATLLLLVAVAAMAALQVIGGGLGNFFQAVATTLGGL